MIPRPHFSRRRSSVFAALCGRPSARRQSRPSQPSAASVELLEGRTLLSATTCINEFEPNPTGGDPGDVSFEISGTPNQAFNLAIVSVENDGPDGRVDRASNVSGTFDGNGLAVVTIPDLENPSFTVILAEGFTGTPGTTDIDTNDDGTPDDLTAFTGIVDALGVSDSAGDDVTLYGDDLGGVNLAFNGITEPFLAFRDGSSGEFYSLVDDGGTTRVFDVAGTEVPGNEFTPDLSAVANTFNTFGSANPARGADTAAPVLSSTDPADDAAGVPVDRNLTLTFNEAVRAGAGDITIRNADTNSVIETIDVAGPRVTFSGADVTVDPTADLPANANIAVRVDAGAIEDAAGNAFAGIADDAAFNFATGAAGSNIDLEVAKAVSNSTPNANGEVTYSVTVTNTGGVAATGVQLRDLVVDAFGRPTNVTVSEGTTRIGDVTTVAAAANAEIRADGAPGTDSQGDGSGIVEFSGATSTLFFNPEGSGNGDFRAFTVADFAIPAMPTVTSFNSATVTLEEDPRGFAAAGMFQVFLATDEDPGLIDVNGNPAPGTPSYQGANDGLAAIDPAFGAIDDGTPLAVATFTPTGAGNQTVVDLTFDTGAGSEFSEFLATVQNGGTARLLFASDPSTPGVAATFAGQGNSDGAPPTISFGVTTGTGADNDITWTGIALDPNESATLTYTVNVGSNSGSFDNFVQVIAADQDTDPDSTPANGNGTTPREDDEAVARVIVQSAAMADLAVTTTDDSDPVFPGGATTYTVVIANNGPNDVAGASLDDTVSFPGGMFTVSGETLTFSNPGAGTGSGTLVVEADGPDVTGLNLAGGETATLTFTVTADTGSGTLTNTAAVSGGTPADPDAANNTAAETTTVTAVPATLTVDTAVDENDGDFSTGDLSLREAVFLANLNADANTIRFAPALSGGTITLTMGELPLASDVTVDGPGAFQLAVDGGGNSRLFNVAPNVTATIRGLSLTGGSAVRGGAVLNAGTLTLADNSVRGNAADLGGAVFAAGGASTTLLRGEFLDNGAADAGGAVHSAGTLAVTGTGFSRNTAGGVGGGVLYNAGGGATLTDAALVQNLAGGPTGSGGAIFTAGGGLAVEGGVLAFNGAARAGGAIEVAGDAAAPVTVTIADASVRNNAATGGGAGAPGNGGALHVSDAAGTVTVGVTRGEFLRNAAATEGGALWNGAGMMTVEGTGFGGNVALGPAAHDGGGAIFNNGGTLGVGRAAFTGNNSRGTLGGGGAIFTAGGTLNVEGGTFDGNAARRAGGAIEVAPGPGTTGAATVGLTDVLLARNLAGRPGPANPGNGGGLHVTGPGAEVTVTRGSNDRNVAANQGGAFWNADGSTLTLDKTGVTRNRAASGGGLYAEAAATTVLIDALFSGNVPDDFGGPGPITRA